MYDSLTDYVEMDESSSEDEETRYLRRICEFVAIEKTITDSSSESSAVEDDEEAERSPGEKCRKSPRRDHGGDHGGAGGSKRRRSSDDVHIIQETSNSGPLMIKRHVSKNGEEEFTVENLVGKATAPKRKPGPLSRTRPDLFRKRMQRYAEVAPVLKEENAGCATPDAVASTGQFSVVV